MKRLIGGCVLLLLLANMAPAKEISGITFPDTCMVKDQNLVLNGVALRKKFVFKVYAAALYLGAASRDAQQVLQADAPRRGVMHFVRDVEAVKINDAWKEGLKGNTPAATDELRKQFDALCAAMEDVKDGDVIEFNYLPGEGTDIVVKGKSKGVQPGKAFSDALFACWIGPKPGPGEGFKKGLLGLK
jgi:hypothetical protein